MTDVTVGTVGAEVVLGREQFNAGKAAVLESLKEIESKFAATKPNINFSPLFQTIKEVKGALNSIYFRPAGITSNVGPAASALQALSRTSAGAAKAIRGLDESLKGVKLDSAPIVKNAEAITDALRLIELYAADAKAAMGTIRLPVFDGSSASKLAAGIDEVGVASAKSAPMVDAMASASVALKAAMTGLAPELRGVATAIGKIGIAAEGAATKLDTLKFDPAPVVEGIDAAKVAVGELDAAAAGAKKTLGSIAVPIRAGRGAGAAAGLGEVAGAAGDAAMGVTAIAAVPAWLAASFDYQSQIVANNTQMDTNRLTEARAIAMRLSNAIGEKPLDIFQGYRQVADYNYKGKEVPEILEPATYMARGTGAPVSDSAQSLAAIMREFQIDPKHGMSTASTLLNAVQHGNLNAAQFEQAFKRPGATTANLGMPLADALAAFITLTQHGYTPAQGGTQVRGLGLSIAAPTSGQLKGIAAADSKYGLNLKDAFSTKGLDALGLPGVLKLLKPLVDAKDTKTLRSILPNQRGLEGAMVLTGKGSTDYALNEKSISGSGQDVKSASDRVNKTPLGRAMLQYQQLMNQLQTDGKLLLPGFTALAKDLTDFAKSIEPNIKAFGGLPVKLQELILGIGTAAGAMKLLGGVRIGGSAGGIGVFTKLFSGGAGKLAAGAAGEVGEGAAGLGIGAMLPEIAAATAAVGAFFAAWRSNFGGVRQIVAQIGKSVGALFTTFTASEGAFVTAVKTTISAMEILWQSHTGRLNAIAHHVWEAIATTFTTGINLVKGVLVIGADLINGDWSKAWGMLKETVVKAWGGIKGVVSNSFQAFGNLIALFFDGVIKPIGEGVKNIVKAIVDGLANGIKNGALAVGDAAKDMAGSVLTAIKEKLGIHSPSVEAHKLGQNVGEGFAQGISSMTPRVAAAVKAIMDAGVIDTAKAHAAIEREARHRLSGVPKGEEGKADRLAIEDWKSKARLNVDESAKSAAATKQTALTGLTADERTRVDDAVDVAKRLDNITGTATSANKRRLKVWSDYHAAVARLDKQAADAQAKAWSAHLDRLNAIMTQFANLKSSMTRNTAISQGKSFEFDDQRDSRVSAADDRYSFRAAEIEDLRTRLGITAHQPIGGDFGKTTTADLLAQAAGERDAEAAQDEYDTSVKAATTSLTAFTAAALRASAVAEGKMSDADSQRDDAIDAAKDRYTSDVADIKAAAPKLGGMDSDVVQSALDAAAQKREAAIGAANSAYDKALDAQTKSDYKDKLNGQDMAYGNGDTTNPARLGELNANLATAKTLFGDTSDEAKDAARAIGEFMDKMKGDSAEAYRGSFERGAMSVTEYVKALRDLQAQLPNTSAEFKQLGKTVDDAVTQSMQRGIEKAKAFGQQFSAVAMSVITKSESFRQAMRRVFEEIEKRLASAELAKIGTQIAKWFDFRVLGQAPKDPGTPAGTSTASMPLALPFGAAGVHANFFRAIPAPSLGTPNYPTIISTPTENVPGVPTKALNAVAETLSDAGGDVKKGGTTTTAAAKTLGLSAQQLSAVAAAMQAASGTQGAGPASQLLSAGMMTNPSTAPFAPLMSSLGNIFHFAQGGTMLPKMPAYVAEHGTGGELVFPQVQSTAIPMNKVRAALGVGGGQQVVHNHGDVLTHIASVNANDPGDLGRLQNAITWGVKNAMPVTSVQS